MGDQRPRDEPSGDRPGSWLDRHLGKLVALLLVLCVAGLAVRALVG